MPTTKAWFLGAAILAMPFVQASATEAPATRCEDVESIGVATMTADGTVSLRIRSLPPGPIAEGVLVYKPGDHDYDGIIKHLGGMAPGQFKPVKPWC